MNAGALTVEAMLISLRGGYVRTEVDAGEEDCIYTIPCASPDVALTAISIGVEATKDAPWENVDSHSRRPAAEAGVDASLSALPLVCHVDPADILFMLLFII